MEKILKYASLLYALSVFLGYFYLDSYYDQFGIKVYSYLDTSEIMLSFLTGTNYFILLSFLILITQIIPAKLISESKANKLLKTKIESKPRYINAWYFFILIQSICMTIFMLYRLIILVSENIENIELYLLILIAIVAFFLFYYGYIRFFEKEEKFSNNSGNKIWQIIFVLLTVCFYTYFMAYFSYKRIIVKDDLAYIEFQYQNEIIHSNDTTVYIGSTKNYIFMHELYTGLNYIYDKNKVSNLKFTSGSIIFISKYNKKLKSVHSE